MVQRQHHLDQTRDPGVVVQVSYIGFDRPDLAKAGFLRERAKRMVQRADFDRVTQRRASTVGFNISDCLGIDVSHGQGL